MSTISDHDQPAPPRSTRRKIAISAAIIFILLLLALLPPLINVSRLRLRIASSISRSIGRPVHLDDVNLYLLPRPGFALKNLVVSEDPAFGNEPVIRASEVDANLRISSLWGKHVEFSSIRFVESDGNHPSLNIVRNAAGRWNLQDILLTAAHANAAPTGQLKAGPAPRFPYIEATGARINLKLGDEKMPFSLTEADFALWLPSPEQWHIRLVGKPARTDTNASDTGEVRLEGTLGRAAKLPDVPLDLTASWAHAQMGEATRLFTGDDEGWRGQVEAGATLTGPLANAQLTTNLHLTDLRRDDFVPAKTLELSTRCTAGANLTTVSLATLACTIPTGAAEPILLTVPTVDLQNPLTAPATISLHQMPLVWALDWARLFSQHIPESTQPTGSLDGDLIWNPTPNSQLQTPNWLGTLHSTFTAATTAENTYDFTPNPITNDWDIDINFTAQPTPGAPSVPTTPSSERAGPQGSGPPGAPSVPTTPSSERAGSQGSGPQGPVLATITLTTTTPANPLKLAITFAPDRTTFTFQGKATQSQLANIGDAILPPLGGNATAILPATAPTTALTLNLQCSLPADTAHPCTNTPTQTPPPETKPKPHHHS